MFHQANPLFLSVFNGVLVVSGAVGFGIDADFATFVGVVCAGFTDVYCEASHAFESE